MGKRREANTEFKDEWLRMDRYDGEGESVGRRERQRGDKHQCYNVPDRELGDWKGQVTECALGRRGEAGAGVWSGRGWSLGKRRQPA